MFPKLRVLGQVRGLLISPATARVTLVHGFDDSHWKPSDGVMGSEALPSCSEMATSP